MLEMCSAAFLLPLTEGERVTLKVVLPPGGTVVSMPLVLIVNSPAFAPSLVKAKAERFPAPVLVMVKTFGALVPPVDTVPKDTGRKCTEPGDGKTATR